MFMVISCSLPFQLPGVKESLLVGATGREGKRGETEGTGRAEAKAGDGQGGEGKEERERTDRPPEATRRRHPWWASTPARGAVPEDQLWSSHHVQPTSPLSLL